MASIFRSIFRKSHTNNNNKKSNKNKSNPAPSTPSEPPSHPHPVAPHPIDPLPTRTKPPTAAVSSRSIAPVVPATIRPDPNAQLASDGDSESDSDYSHACVPSSISSSHRRPIPKPHYPLPSLPSQPPSESSRSSSSGHSRRFPLPALPAVKTGVSDIHHDDALPVALDPSFLARPRLGSTPSLHQPLSPTLGPSSHPTSPRLAPPLFGHVPISTCRGSPASHLGFPSPLVPLESRIPVSPTFYGHIAPSPNPYRAGYAPMGSGLRSNPSLTSLHSVHALGSALPPPSPLSPNYYPSPTSHPFLRSSPSVTSLSTVATATHRHPVGTPSLRPSPSFASLCTVNSLADLPSGPVHRSPLPYAPGLHVSDYEDDQVLGVRALHLNPSVGIPTPARSRAASNASITVAPPFTHSGPPMALAVESSMPLAGLPLVKDKMPGSKSKKHKKHHNRKRVNDPSNDPNSGCIPSHIRHTRPKNSSGTTSASDSSVRQHQKHHRSRPHYPVGTDPSPSPSVPSRQNR